eukprot:m.141653 g.141653  ORF g.141653 m.141653 type:complete len:122 (+) comp30201_c1_seq5:30-395(+)
MVLTPSQCDKKKVSDGNQATKIFPTPRDQMMTRKGLDDKAVKPPNQFQTPSRRDQRKGLWTASSQTRHPRDRKRVSIQSCFSFLSLISVVFLCCGCLCVLCVRIVFGVFFVYILGFDTCHW